MNALNMTGLKMLACGAVAVAVTWMGSWSFVASTAVVRGAVQPMQVVAGAVVETGSQVARAAAAGLLQ